MAQDWDIKPRGNLCVACEAPFEDDQVCFSTLVFDAEGYRRADFCTPCWTSRPPDPATISSWKGVYVAPRPPPETEPGKETAETLLRRLVAEHDASKTSVAYILAVMLERRRVLIEREVRKGEDGSRMLVYEHKVTGESFLIPDPCLRLDDLGPVQRQVIDMLAAKGAAPPAAAAGPHV